MKGKLGEVRCSGRETRAAVEVKKTQLLRLRECARGEG